MFWFWMFCAIVWFASLATIGYFIYDYWKEVKE